MNNITEVGNIALSYPKTDSHILINADDKAGEYSIFSFNGKQYPRWNVYTQFFYGEELDDYIMDNFSEWHVNEMNNVDVNVSTTPQFTYIMDRIDIANEIVQFVIKKAYDNDYNPVETEGMIEDCIDQSAEHKKYFMTERLRNQCLAELYWYYSA